VCKKLTFLQVFDSAFDLWQNDYKGFVFWYKLGLPPMIIKVFTENHTDATNPITAQFNNLSLKKFVISNS